MKYFFLFLIVCALLINVSCTKNGKTKYQPTFESLEQADPVPEWFKDAKFGIYFHWGVYAVPAFSNEWYPRNMYRVGSPENLHHIRTYGIPAQWPYHQFITGGTDAEGNFIQFAPKLKSEGGNFDPAEWAQLFADAGARFAGPVAEHHDGFSMWASKVNPWNAKDRGPGIDLVDVLAKEIRKRDMKLILSMHHAYNFTGFFEAVPPTDDPELKILYGQQGKEKNEELWLEKHKEIIDFYQPDIIWQDFNLSAITDTVLLQFLAYYYNDAEERGKEVVATFKDGLNTKCAVLDFERGGPTDLTDHYWLTDDAISSSSWCYTEGIGYYSKKQILHGFLDRVSKNGNLLLNISPKADGTIPAEQREALLAMGDWLKKYGEAVYDTRAWEKYGEGPTKMGAAHGVFTAPKEGTPGDVRYTRSKDNTALYAILLGWDKDQGSVVLKALSDDRINLASLNEVLLINGVSGVDIPLSFVQDETGLTITLPEKSFDELAYVLKLTFDGKIPDLDQYVEINCEPNYYLSPGGKSTPVLGAQGTLSSDRNNPAQQWTLEKVGRGLYLIISRENEEKALTAFGAEVRVEKRNGEKSQVWHIEASKNALLMIRNAEFPDLCLSLSGDKAVLLAADEQPLGWQLLEKCEKQQAPFKKHRIPGVVEVEDFDLGCPGDAYYDQDETNAGGKYRPNEGVDIEVCSAGGFNTGWAKSGEWMAYTVHVLESGSYTLKVYVATPSEQSSFHVEVDGVDATGTIHVKSTGGYQNWEDVAARIQLSSGTHVLRLVFDDIDSGLNLDKMVFVKDESL